MIFVFLITKSSSTQIRESLEKILMRPEVLNKTNPLKHEKRKLQNNSAKKDEEIITLDSVWIDKETDKMIRDSVIYFMLGVTFFMLIMAIRGCIKMRILTSFLKYCKEENDINKELFSKVKGEFMVDLPKNFDEQFDKLMVNSLNGYYEE